MGVLVLGQTMRQGWGGVGFIREGIPRNTSRGRETVKPLQEGSVRAQLPLGASGSCLRGVPPARRGSWGIYTPSPISHWVRAAPGDQGHEFVAILKSSPGAPKEGPKAHG